MFSWLRASLYAILAGTFLFSADAKADEKSKKKDEIAEIDPSTTPSLGLVYSWMDIKSKGTETVRITGHRAGLSFEANARYLSIRVGGGLEKLRLRYNDPSYRDNVKDLSLDLQGEPTPYIGAGLRGRVPIGAFDVGPFCYLEASTMGDVELDSLDARLSNGSTVTNETFNVDDIASMQYQFRRVEAGVIGGFTAGGFRLGLALAYARFSLDLKASYTDTGRTLIDSLELDNRAVNTGEFANNTNGAYARLDLSQRIGLFVIGANGDIILVDSSLAYIVGGNVRVLLPYQPKGKKKN